MKDFSNDSYIVYSWFPRREVTVFFKLMRKGEQKPSPHVASRVIKGIRIIFENEARVCGGDYYFGPRYIHRDLQRLSSVPLLGWKRNCSRT
jgi:hypothetical protein